MPDSTTIDLNAASFTANGVLGWRHALGEVTPDATMRIAADGAVFSIQRVPMARDAADVEAGLDYTRSATFDVGYGGRIGDGDIDQSLGANVILRFRQWDPR